MSDLLARYRPELELNPWLAPSAAGASVRLHAAPRVIACGMAMIGVESVYPQDQRTRDIFSIRRATV